MAASSHKGLKMLTTCWAVGLVAVAMAAAPLQAAARSVTLYAGSYTTGTSKGIYAWRFDTDKGSLQPLGLVAETSQPAHIWAAPNGRTLYAVNWDQPGSVSSFRVDRKTAKLTPLNQVPSEGLRPNQIVVDPTGRIAATVNYRSGTLAAFRVLPDGSLSNAFYTEQYAGKPRAPNRTGPNTHGIQFGRDGRLMWIAELGLDRVYSYRVDPRRARITPADPPFVSLHAGAGPRRLQLSPDGRFLYVNHETDSEVSVFAVTGPNLVEVQTISTLPPGSAGANTTSEIIIDKAGRHLYVGNRGHDSIAVFDVDRASGRLQRKANVPSGGRTPRNLRIDPTGKYLLSANEDGGSIAVLRINRATGELSLTGSSAKIDKPGGLYFVE